jgi:hypothetical protein
LFTPASHVTLDPRFDDDFEEEGGMSQIEVHWSGRGVMRGDDAVEDAATAARCGGCGATDDPVAGAGGELMLCPSCLRARLDAVSVARWRLRGDDNKGIPWGKNAG